LNRLLLGNFGNLGNLDFPENLHRQKTLAVLYLLLLLKKYLY
jgi:hypothetical protein